MPALRLLFIVLILLNALALAANLGWLGSSQPRGEPERITNQLNPERIVLAPDEARPPDDAPPPESVEAPPEKAPAELAAPAPEQAPLAQTETLPVEQACIAYAGLTERQADALERAALAAPQALHAARELDRRPSGWWVSIPPSANREGAERKVAELRALGINDYFIIQEPGPNQFAVSLGVFRTESAARQHLAFLQGKRIRNAQLAPRNGVIHRIEIRGPAPGVAALAERLKAEQPAARQGECAS